MVRSLVVSVVVLLGVLLSGCSGLDIMRQATVEDVHGVWVLREEGGSGVARLELFEDGRFEATGWPKNLQTYEDGVWDPAKRVDELEWDSPVTLTGDWEPDGTGDVQVAEGRVQLYGDNWGRKGVTAILAHVEFWGDCRGMPWSCEYVDAEMRINPNGHNDEFNFCRLFGSLSWCQVQVVTARVAKVKRPARRNWNGRQGALLTACVLP